MAATTIDLQSATGIDGKFLADGQGRALYLFEADKGSTSTCTGACAAAWPPVTASAMPMAGGGVSQSLLGTTKRADGTEQLTYNGHPLYYFAADTGSGMAKGQGTKAFGAGWYVLNAKGVQDRRRLTRAAISRGGRPNGPTACPGARQGALDNLQERP